jgi:YVTN family beta-propeller protein
MKSFITLAIILSHAAFAQESSLPMTKLNVCNEIPISGDWMGIGFDSVWEMSGGALNRLSVDTNKIVAKLPISYGPFRGITTGEGFVWVPDVGQNKLFQIDPATNTIVKTFELPISNSEGSIAVGDGYVWIAVDGKAGESRELKKINVKTGEVSPSIPLPSSVAGTSFADGKVFLTSPDTGEVIVVDPQSNAVAETIKVGEGPRFISAGGGSVWVLNQDDGKVVKIDPSSKKIIATIDAKLAGGGGDITYGEGAVWVTMPGIPVVKINPETNAVVKQYNGYGMGDAIRAAYGSVWVSGSKLHRIETPKR